MGSRSPAAAGAVRCRPAGSEAAGGRHRAVRHLAALVALAAAVSLAGSATTIAGARHPAGAAAGARALLEAAALAAPVLLVARWSPVRPAVLAVALGILAVTLLPPRLMAPAPLLDMAAAGAFWALAPAGAAVAGWHLRRQEACRARAVAAARRAQRAALARDLHDFVAHDVSEMLAQAQAAQVVAGDAATALAALRRIEAAGLHALSAMDRTVRMLGDGEAGGATPDVAAPGLADLPDLVERFAAAGPAAAALDLDPGLPDGVPPEVATTVYRVVVEALTNVRRHAATAGRVAVAVAGEAGPDGPRLRVRVTDDGGPRPPASSRRGGLGLPGLAERVEALGGTLAAGPREGGGWRVTAALPLPRRPEGTR
jgi:signal transduction histidine kinase